MSEFASEPRNLRLTLTIDGIKLYSSINSKYSYWLVMLVNYHGYAWERMLTLLISGPKQLENGIDVFLERLIDYLIFLWIKKLK